ncbi:unnamed protein product [Amoebophrya sp. A120]|nr:unnamed protein product [Amoebophrya sp. A120]|eukprot:GSA120T00008805001.1
MVNRVKLCSCGAEQSMVVVVAALFLFVALQSVCGIALVAQRAQEGPFSPFDEPQGNGYAAEDCLCPGGLQFDGAEHGSLRRAIATFGPPTARHFSEQPGRKNPNPPTETQREPVPPGWDCGGLCFGCGSRERFEQDLKQGLSWRLLIMFVHKRPGTTDGWTVADPPRFRVPWDVRARSAIDVATSAELGFWSPAPPGPFEHWVGPLKIQRSEDTNWRVWVRYAMIYRYPLKIQGSDKAYPGEGLKWIQNQMPAVLTVSHALVDSHYGKLAARHENAGALLQRRPASRDQAAPLRPPECYQ